MERFEAAARRLAGASSRLLGWAPDLFWAATPTDLINSLGGHGDEAASIDRDRLRVLCATFPD